MYKNNPSAQQFELISQRFKILSDPTRLKLLHALKDGERNVQSLVNTGETTQANVSKHLTLMLEAGLIHRRKEGLNSYYRIADPGIFTLCEIVCDSIENNLLERIQKIRR